MTVWKRCFWQKLGVCSTRFEHGLATWGLADRLMGVDPLEGGGSDAGADGSEEVGAPNRIGNRQ